MSAVKGFSQVPVVVLFGLSRVIEARSCRQPLLSDLPIYVEDYADLVTLLYRPDVYEPDTAIGGLVEVAVARNSNGGAFYSTWLNYDPDCLYLEEADEF